MRFLLLAYGHEQKCKALTEDQMKALGKKCQERDEELKRTGKMVGAGSLSWDSMTIRPKDGKPTVTDGPFIEAREVVGGFIIIEARDMNEAIQIAKLHPAATLGEELGWGIEIRQFDVCALPKD